MVVGRTEKDDWFMVSVFVCKILKMFERVVRFGFWVYISQTYIANYMHWMIDWLIFIEAKK